MAQAGKEAGFVYGKETDRSIEKEKKTQTHRAHGRLTSGVPAAVIPAVILLAAMLTACAGKPQAEQPAAESTIRTTGNGQINDMLPERGRPVISVEDAEKLMEEQQDDAE